MKKFWRKDLLWYLAFVLVFLIHQVMQEVGVHVPILDNYLDPFTAIPVMLGTPLMIFRIWQIDAIFYKVTTIAFTVILIGVFETTYVVEVKIHPDVWDIPMYVAGMLVFLWKINPPPLSLQSES
ncbi:hypothetical protein [Phaeocystidibacter marisrubri]|uniref:Uncharacterized protein n=1 Tax=Phaeocystidibacter marisrubri TaxID=1577780 RepID=A0A6L3ZDE4_9FLAO|nr:hypothetical protein [Phaeocystidibacter marisrubri]KAB2815863.1 hypothetical protein F8C82_09195 [Phaeocystidibacter marisrubri]